MLPQSGGSFGRYDIGRRLGQGGMGVVFAATHRDLDREVALKLLAPDLSEDGAYRNRFLREAKALAKLDSQYVVRVHDAGEQDGWLFITTELVPDGDLNQLLADGGLPLPIAADLVAQVAQGLQVAHDAGILHRDIKPSNVLVRKLGDGSLRAVLCDLGISTVQDAEHTVTIGVIGTPRYMAPERHEGADASVATDIYSLGCLLWAVVTGRAPYEGTASQVLLGHLHGEIPQLPGGSPAERAINGVIATAMAKEPTERYASASGFAGALADVLDPEPAAEDTVLSPTPVAPKPVEDRLAKTLVGRSASAPRQIGVRRHTPPPNPIKVTILPDGKPLLSNRAIKWSVSLFALLIASSIIWSIASQSGQSAEAVAIEVHVRATSLPSGVQFDFRYEPNGDEVVLQVSREGRLTRIWASSFFVPAARGQKVCIQVRAVIGSATGPWSSACRTVEG